MKSMMYIIIVLLGSFYAWADQTATVILNNDSSFTGTVITKTVNEVVLRLDNGTIKSIQRSDIRELLEHDVTLKESSSRSWRDPLAFWCIGVTLGSPAGINLRGGYHTGTFAIHGSGMYLGDLRGVQINPMICVSQCGHTEHYIAGMLGSLQVPVSTVFGGSTLATFTYAGAGYCLHSYGFLLELGLVGGSGYFSSPQVMFQIGYVAKIF